MLRTGTDDRIANRLGSVHATHSGAAEWVALCFCDVARFSELTERLGDREAHRVIREFQRVVQEELARHRGELVEVRGDGFFLAFRSADAALSCAVALQRSLAARRGPQLPLWVRVGLHAGESLRDGGGYFGKTVIVAARVGGLAAPGEILVSSQLRDALSPDAAVAITPARVVRLKGLRGRYQLFGVDWVARDEGPGAGNARRGSFPHGIAAGGAWLLAALQVPLLGLLRLLRGGLDADLPIA